jgi:predicted branched-subunit amino acid permease
VIDPQTFGLDAAFPAAFIAMAWSQLGDRRGRLAAVLGATIYLVLNPVAPIGVPILCASLAALVGLPPRPGTPTPAPEGVVA